MFGGNPNTAPGGGGFTFGQSQPQAQKFAFGATSPPNTGFTFGTPQQSVGSTPSGTGGFAFGSPAGGMGQAGLGAASPPSTGFTFGAQTADKAPTTGYAFGATPVSTAVAGSMFDSSATATTGFSSFGQTAPAVSSAAGGGYSFGQSTLTTPAGGGGFSFVQQPAANQSTGNTGFNFGGQSIASPPNVTGTGLPFGQQSTPAAGTTSFTSFGQTAAVAPVQSSTGITFGQTNTSSASAFGSGFSGFSSAPAPAAATTTSFAPSGGIFNFNTNTVAPAAPVETVPVSSTAAPTSTFGNLWGAPGNATTVQAQAPPFSTAPKATTGGMFGTTVQPQPALGQFNTGFTSSPVASTGVSFQTQPVAAPITVLPTATTTAPAASFDFGSNPNTGFKVTSTPIATIGSIQQQATSLPTQAPTSVVAPLPTAATLPAVSTQPAPSAGFTFGSTPKSGFGLLTTSTPVATLATFSTSSISSPTTSVFTQEMPAKIASTSASIPTTSVVAPVTTSSVPPVTWSFGGTTSTSAISSVASTQAQLSTATTTVASSVASLSAPGITFRQLEEDINKWTMELEDQEKVFLTQATQVNAWDRLLIANSEKITELNDLLQKVKLDQTSLEQEIDFIQAQQRELEDLVAPIENHLETTPSLNIQLHADIEREHTYQLAENIDAQLRRMTKDLREVIDHLNANNANQDSNNPVQQIGKILNVHMDSLQWIERHASILERKVEEVCRLQEIREKDHERLLHLSRS